MQVLTETPVPSPKLVIVKQNSYEGTWKYFRCAPQVPGARLGKGDTVLPYQSN